MERDGDTRKKYVKKRLFQDLTDIFQVVILKVTVNTFVTIKIIFWGERLLEGKYMQQRKVVRAVLGASLVLSFGVFGRYVVSSSTTMGTETELAGMSYTLDQYCAVQTGAMQSDPEAIVAFDDDVTMGDGGGTVVSGTAVNGDTPETTTAPEASATPKPESEYANVGISIAKDYVNIRKNPNLEAEIIGKLYRGSAATISETKGDWVRIKSGSVTGWINKDYLAIGYSAEKLIDKFGTKWATVTTETLRVREEKNIESAVLTLVSGDESYEVLKEETEWAKICVDGDTTGYVSKEYVKITVQFKKAVSLEEEREEERRKAAAAEAERKQREEEQRRAASENNNNNNGNSGNKNSGGNNSSGGQKSTGSGGSSNGGGSGSNTGSGGSSGGGSGGGSSEGSGGATGGDSSSDGGGGSVLGSGDGSAVASYALQFVGNPYVWGGTSLTHGTDCSGFALSVFRKFGISLPRTSGEQSRKGKKIKVSEARAGDLIFYASGGRVNHVAICIGGGRVVHASRPGVGITTSNINYRTPYCARRVLG